MHSICNFTIVHFINVTREWYNIVVQNENSVAEMTISAEMAHHTKQQRRRTYTLIITYSTTMKWTKSNILEGGGRVCKNVVVLECC